MTFEWDESKNQINKQKHGVSFETASSVFSDEHKIELYDELHSTDEETRWNVIGKTAENVILFVVDTEIREDVVRIISARPAKKTEKEFYYANGNV